MTAGPIMTDAGQSQAYFDQQAKMLAAMERQNQLLEQLVQDKQSSRSSAADQQASNV